MIKDNGVRSTDLHLSSLSFSTPSSKLASLMSFAPAKSAGKPDSLNQRPLSHTVLLQSIAGVRFVILQSNLYYAANIGVET